MSLFNVVGMREKIPGVIKNRSAKNSSFGHFSIDDKVAMTLMNGTFKSINQNLRSKNLKGELVFCPFVNHDGKVI